VTSAIVLVMLGLWVIFQTTRGPLPQKLGLAQ